MSEAAGHAMPSPSRRSPTPDIDDPDNLPEHPLDMVVDDPPPDHPPLDDPPLDSSKSPSPITAETPEPEGRPKRTRRLPTRFREELPTRLAPVGNLQQAPEPESEPERRLPRVNLIVRDTFRTVTNRFNLWRSYLHRPTYDPDSLLTTDDLSNQFLPAHDPEGRPHHPPNLPLPPDHAPLNASASLLLSWQNNGHTTKSANQLNALVSDVLLQPEFSLDDLVGFNAEHAEKEAEKEADEAFPLLKQFKHASVQIEVPSGSTDVPSRMVDVPGLWYRSLVSVIRAAFADPLAKHLHLSPFKLFHKVRSTEKDIRVFSELYNSDAFIEEDDKVRRNGELPPDEQHCKLEKVVAALMFWSDSTHLANFGTAKLWPIYLLFGNLSKYFRDKPEYGAEHHIAYIPSVSLFAITVRNC
ncbi:hypothetical protein C8F01DRAFT_1064576 [Mycena amicta]|nr:hypothetical protein C8F01DRAFT_1064576 [Mycena amicta]